MKEKNIFAYKLFLLLNISDFNLFLCENCNPPIPPSNPPLSQQPPLKVEVLSSPPSWRFGWRLNPLQKGGRCPLWYFPLLITAPTTHFSNFHFSICEVPTNRFSISDSNFGTPHFHDFSDVHMNKKLQKKKKNTHTQVDTLVKINGCTNFHLSFLIRGEEVGLPHKKEWICKL